MHNWKTYKEIETFDRHIKSCSSLSIKQLIIWSNRNSSPVSNTSFNFLMIQCIFTKSIVNSIIGRQIFKDRHELINKRVHSVYLCNNSNLFKLYPWSFPTEVKLLLIRVVYCAQEILLRSVVTKYVVMLFRPSKERFN